MLKRRLDTLERNEFERITIAHQFKFFSEPLRPNAFNDYRLPIESEFFQANIQVNPIKNPLFEVQTDCQKYSFGAGGGFAVYGAVPLNFRAARSAINKFIPQICHLQHCVNRDAKIAPHC